MNLSKNETDMMSHLRDFYSKDRIEKGHKLGVTQDDFNRYLSRAYAIDSSLEYSSTINRMIAERKQWYREVNKT